MITHLGSINLGDTRAVSGLSLRVGYDHAKHDKPLGKPSKQRLGGRLEEWRLTMNLNHHFCDPQSVLDELKTLCDDGVPVQLVFDYVNYKGWVTLDDMDVNYQEIAVNGKPLSISGSITLTEFVGDTTPKPSTPAVRELGNTADNPAPVQTALTDDVTTLLPTRQPMQHLEDALIAQHRASRLMREMAEGVEGVQTGDGIEAINTAIGTVNDYFASEDWFGGDVPTLPAYEQGDPFGVLLQMDSQTVFYTELARQAVVRVA